MLIYLKIVVGDTLLHLLYF